jgi:hypothetical protein
MTRPLAGDVMGLIRKSLFVATGGIVAPRSKKQKTALQTFAALQGAAPAEVKRKGTRRAALGPITEASSWQVKPRRRVDRVSFTPEELEYLKAHTAKPKKDG